MELKKRLRTTGKPESLSVPQNLLADNEVPFCAQLLGHSMKADISLDQMRFLVLETIYVDYPADQWLQVFTDESYVESQGNVCVL
nr:reverse transcriptase [Hymenolepis microstoma]